MKNIKTTIQNQKGFAHLGLIIVIVAVTGAVGMAGYTVYMNENHKEESARLSAEKTAQEEAKKAAELKLKEVEAQQADDKPVEVTTPSEIKPAEQIPTTTKKSTATTPTKTEPKPTYIKFTSVEHSYTDGTLNVIATLPQAYSGKCKLYMTQGEVAYKKPIEVSNTTTCNISINASELPSAGNWEWYMYFWTLDGLVNASSAGYTQEF
jgi:type II secretory pathway pseudopilin PulG